MIGSLGRMAVLAAMGAATIAAAPAYTHIRAADNAAGIYANCVFDKAEDLSRLRRPLAETQETALASCAPMRGAAMAWHVEHFNALKERSQDDLDFIDNAVAYSLDKETAAIWRRYNAPLRGGHRR